MGGSSLKNEGHPTVGRVIITSSVVYVLRRRFWRIILRVYGSVNGVLVIVLYERFIEVILLELPWSR